MSFFLGFTETELTQGTAINTAREINQQPGVIRALSARLDACRADASAFLQKVYQKDGYDIIMTGAGSSEMIGNALLPMLTKKHPRGQVRSIGTTSLLTSPTLYFDQPDRPTLLVSFARSGNSPESVGVVDLADQVLTNVYHLMITCNENGELAKRAKADNVFCVLMPPETNDLGFAMTSSVTSMYLSGYALLSNDSAADFAAQATLVAKLSEQYITGHTSDILALSKKGFDRIVFLGADNTKGTAQECALKTLELTNGGIPTLFDTPMGFRHGPKSFVTDNTMVVVFLSEDAYTRRYEIDILKELYTGSRTCTVVAVAYSDSFAAEYAPFCHVSFAGKDTADLTQAFLSIPYVVLGQLLAFGVSFCNGHTTDTPCPDKAVSRVVSGVTVYPYNA